MKYSYTFTVFIKTSFLFQFFTSIFQIFTSPDSRKQTNGEKVAINRERQKERERERERERKKRERERER
jgi:hypothetical protein